jgi:hypothetical protein
MLCIGPDHPDVPVGICERTHISPWLMAWGDDETGAGIDGTLERTSVSAGVAALMARKHSSWPGEAAWPLPTAASTGVLIFVLAAARRRGLARPGRPAPHPVKESA